MTPKTKQDAIDIIEARLKERSECSPAWETSKATLEGEITMAIDLSHMFGAIGLDEQRHYKQRLARIIENDNRQWAEQHRRIS